VQGEEGTGDGESSTQGEAGQEGGDGDCAEAVAWDAALQLDWAYMGGGGLDDAVTDIALLAGGDIVVAGYAESQSDDGGEVFLRRLTQVGEEVWAKQFDTDVAQYNGQYVSVVSDGSERIYLAFTDESGPERLAMLRAYDMDGAEQWEQSWGGAGYNGARDVDLADDGSIVVASDVDFDFDLRRFDGEGNELWSDTWDGAGGANANAVVVRGDDVAVAGEDSSSALLAFYELGGAPISTQSWGTDYGDHTFGIATNGSDFFVTTIEGQQANPEDFIPGVARVRQFAADGSEGWVHDASDEQQDFGAIAVDPGGEVFAVGSLVQGMDWGNDDIGIVHLGADGELRETTLFATEPFRDVPLAVVAGECGELYVGGLIENDYEGQVNQGGADWLLLRFSRG
jgi:hypothetical protein